MQRDRTARPKDERAFHHGDLSRALSARALELLDAEGLEAVAVRRLARDLRVDPAALYRHHRGRDGLLGAVAHACFVELAEATERAIARRSTPEDGLRAAGSAYVAYALRYPARFRLMFGALGSGPGALERPPGVASSGRTAWQAIEQLVREMHDLAPLREAPADAATAAWAAVHGLAALFVDGPLRGAPPRRRNAAIRATLDTVLAGLRGG